MVKSRKKESKRPFIRIGRPILNIPDSHNWALPLEGDIPSFEDVVEIIPYGNSGVFLLRTLVEDVVRERLVLVDIAHNIHMSCALNKPIVFISSKSYFSFESLTHFVSVKSCQELIQFDRKWRDKKDSVSEISYFEDAIKRRISCDLIIKQGIMTVDDNYFYGFLLERIERHGITFEEYMRYVLNKEPIIAPKRKMLDYK